jgi:hypothetical protein
LPPGPAAGLSLYEEVSLRQHRTHLNQSEQIAGNRAGRSPDRVGPPGLGSSGRVFVVVILTTKNSPRAVGLCERLRKSDRDYGRTGRHGRMMTEINAILNSIPSRTLGNISPADFLEALLGELENVAEAQEFKGG